MAGRVEEMDAWVDPWAEMDTLFEDAGLEGGGLGEIADHRPGALYFAYGSNLNERQMSWRCPDAIKLGEAQLRGWRLTFSGVADIRQAASSVVPGGLWAVSPRDLRALDRYEGFPHLYGRKEVQVELLADERDEIGVELAWVYFMIDEPAESLPSPAYFEAIVEGYRDFGLNPIGLKQIVMRAGKAMRARGIDRLLVDGKRARPAPRRRKVAR